MLHAHHLRAHTAGTNLDSSLILTERDRRLAQPVREVRRPRRGLGWPKGRGLGRSDQWERLDQRLDDVVCAQSAPPCPPIELGKRLVPVRRPVVVDELRRQLIERLAAGVKDYQLVRRLPVLVATSDRDGTWPACPHEGVLRIAVPLGATCARRFGKPFAKHDQTTVLLS